MQKSKIEWTDYVWNPIKGICPVGCWYCYGRRMYQRFKRDPKLSWDGLTPLLSHLKPSRVFVCSTIEMFHPAINQEWRDDIFEIIKAPHNQKHTFIILTKMPERIDRPMPENVHLGVSVTCPADLWRIDALSRCHTEVPFVSFEPMLEPVVPPNGIFLGLKWAIIGKLTGHGKKHDPARDDIELMINGARLFGVPIFMKENLKNVWKSNLIQEYPT